MARAGCEVVIYEALHRPGGVLSYGIPEFRLPNSIVDAEFAKVTELGVTIECNTLAGRLFTVEQLRDEMGFDAVFIGTGAGYPSFMGIPGESLNGVLSANEFLTRCNLMQAGQFPAKDTPLHMGRKVVVIGAGNTAMDAMRVSKRLGAEEVYCLYRRTRAESPARVEELEHAEEEGVTFEWLTAPVEILGDDENNMRGLRCIRMQLGEPDGSGRPRPVPIEGSEFEFEADMAIYAIGTNANPIIGQTSNVELNARGYIEADDEQRTSLAGVFAGGDIVTGGATVILAMGAGRQAAAAMKRYLGIPDLAEMDVSDPDRARIFGIDARQRNFRRIRVAA
jgi:glutamate synthase (NADPH/NADH) small chain